MSTFDNDLSMTQAAPVHPPTEQQVAAQWVVEHGDVVQWCTQHKDRSTFAASLYQQYTRRGRLSEGQVGAVRRILEEGRVKQQAWEQRQRQEAALPSTGLDLAALPAGYYAVPQGGTRLKVRVRRPGKNSRWYGYTFVSDGAAYGYGKNYGRQAPGGLYVGEIVSELRAIVANPQEASATYGKLTGVCGVCGRHLEDEESVARGIGPVCAGRLGWR